MAQLRREQAAFQRLGARVVLVGLGNVEETAAFKKRFDVPFPMIADPERRLFDAFRLKRASAGSLLSTGMVFKGLKAIAKGHGIGVPTGDVRQLPGAADYAATRIEAPRSLSPEYGKQDDGEDIDSDQGLADQQ